MTTDFVRIDKLTVHGRTWRFKYPILAWQYETGSYRHLQYAPLNLSAMARISANKSAVYDAFADCLAAQWDLLAMADDDNLTEDARRVKYALLMHCEEVK